MVYTKKEWQKRRNAAGGSGGAAKGVSVSDLLDKFHAAVKRKAEGSNYWLGVTRATGELSKGLEKYRSDPKVSANRPLAALVEAMQMDLRDFSAKIPKQGNPAYVLGKALGDIKEQAAKVQASGDAQAYKELYLAATAGLKKPMDAVTAQLSSFKAARGGWVKSLDPKVWSPKGKQLKNWEGTPQLIPLAAKQVAQVARRLEDELREAIIGESEF